MQIIAEWFEAASPESFPGKKIIPKRRRDMAATLEVDHHPYEHFYLAKQAIFDASGNIWGYELLFRDGPGQRTAVIDNADMATLCVATCGFLKSGEEIERNKKVLINFTERLLVEGVPRGLPPSVTVVEILENIRPSDRILEAVIRLKQDGYLVAVDDFEGDMSLAPLLDLADIIKVDVLNKDIRAIGEIHSRIQASKAIKLAEKVEHVDIIPPLKEMGFSLFQGYYFAKPKLVSGRKVSSSALSKLRTLQVVEKSDVTPEELAKTIKADPSIAYRLLRFVNSAAFGFSMKISSIEHAVMLIGARRLKYWLRMVILSDISATKKNAGTSRHGPHPCPSPRGTRHRRPDPPRQSGNHVPVRPALADRGHVGHPDAGTPRRASPAQGNRGWLPRNGFGVFPIPRPPDRPGTFRHRNRLRHLRKNDDSGASGGGCLGAFDFLGHFHVGIL